MKTTESLGAIELLQGLTVEEMRAVYFDSEALIEPPYKVYQLNSKGYRYYYRMNENGEPEFYPSVTTILSKVMPKSPHLIKWIADKGLDEAEKYKMERASYGTFMHGVFLRLLIAREYDLDKLKDELAMFAESERLGANFIYYADDLKKDVLAFAAWVMDYDVRPMAVEIPLVHPEKGYAGMLDLPCTMLDKIGGKNRIRALVDFKSGRKGFFEEHELQLHLYRDMWNVNFPGKEIERVFNFSPKDWRKYPNYNFTDQTDSKNAAKIPAILAIAEIEDGKKDNLFTSISGVVSLSNNNLMENVKVMTLAEVIKSRKEKGDEKPAAAVEVKDLPKEEEEDDKLNDLLYSDF